jgi:hypothetical protein
MRHATTNTALHLILSRIPGRERPHANTTAALMRELANLKPETIVIMGHRRYCTVPLDLCLDLLQGMGGLSKPSRYSLTIPRRGWVVLVRRTVSA